MESSFLSRFRNNTLSDTLPPAQTDDTLNISPSDVRGINTSYAPALAPEATAAVSASAAESGEPAEDVLDMRKPETTAAEEENVPRDTTSLLATPEESDENTPLSLPVLRLCALTALVDRVQLDALVCLCVLHAP